jgi:hypothetical protein
MNPRDRSFSEFYAAYLGHHRHPANRALHMLAKLLAITAIAAAAYLHSLLALLAAPALAVAPCWLGHLWFEGNRPVSWEQPSASLLGTLGALVGIRRKGIAIDAAAGAGEEVGRGQRAYYSFLADLRMCGEMLTGKAGAGSASDPT